MQIGTGASVLAINSLNTTAMILYEYSDSSIVVMGRFINKQTIVFHFIGIIFDIKRGCHVTVLYWYRKYHRVCTIHLNHFAKTSKVFKVQSKPGSNVGTSLQV